MLLGYCIGKLLGLGMVIRYGTLLGYYFGISLQSEDVFLELFINGTALCFIVWMSSKIIDTAYGFAIVITEWTELGSIWWICLFIWTCTESCKLWESINGEILWSELIIWFGSKLGNYNALSLERFEGGGEYGKRPGGDFRILTVSKMGTYYGIWMGARLGWKVGIIKVSLLKSIMGVIIGLLLIKPVEYLFGSMIVSEKVSVKWKIFVLSLGDAYGATLGISGGWKCDVISWKDPVSILGSIK